MPASENILGPVELAKLEHSFASDPVSDAYKPLASAYLAMGRFMEAMVVCKKGVKSHAHQVEPLLLLAQVYAAQNKHRKAIEELTSALKVAPSNKLVLRSLGTLQLRSGDAEAGKTNLLSAWKADPSDAETLEAMREAGLSIPTTEKPSAKPMQKATATATATAAPQLRPLAAAAQAKAIAPLYDDLDEEDEDYRPEKASGAPKISFLILIVAVPLGVSIYYGIGQYRAKHIRAANIALRKSATAIKTDQYKGYKESIKSAQQGLDHDGSSTTNRLARGFLAYASVILWGEHQRDEATRGAAELNVRNGLKAKKSSAYLHSANALLEYYSDKPDEALKIIEKWIADAVAQKKQVSFYYLTRGIIQTYLGDLEAAKASLRKAQSILPDSPRVFIALGKLHMLRHSHSVAMHNFKVALRLTDNSHPDALLGTAQLILNKEDPRKEYLTAAQHLKSLAESEPPPSSKQLAQMHLIRAQMISSVSADLKHYKDAALVKKLEAATGVTADAQAAQLKVVKEETAGLALDPHNPHLLILRAQRLARENKLDEAVDEIQKAIKKEAANPYHYVALAEVLMRQKEGAAEAEKQVKKALLKNPKNPTLLTLLAQVQYRQNKYEDALQTLKKAVSAPNPAAQLLLGKFTRDVKKDYSKAIELFNQVAKKYLQDPTQAAMSYDELGQTYELLKDKDKVRTSYEKALNADKDYPSAYCHYARFLMTLKNSVETRKARVLAKEFLKLTQRGQCVSKMRAIARK